MEMKTKNPLHTFILALFLLSLLTAAGLNNHPVNADPCNGSKCPSSVGFPPDVQENTQGERTIHTGNLRDVDYDRKKVKNRANSLRVVNQSSILFNSHLSFSKSVFIEDRGDIVDIKLLFGEGATSGTIIIRSTSSDLKIELKVADNDQDGEVTLHWNTYESNNINAGFSASGGSVSDVDVANQDSHPIPSDEYAMSAIYDGTETDIATTLIRERSTGDLTIHTAPAGATPETMSQLRQIASSSGVGNTIAVNQLTANADLAIIRLKVSGIEGYVDSLDDLDKNGLSLIVEGANGQQNIAAEDSNDVLFLKDNINNTYYVVFDPTDVLPSATAGDTITATFSIDSSSNDVTPSDERISRDFVLVPGTIEIKSITQEILITPSDDAQLKGTSSFAPGTKISVRLQSVGTTVPFKVTKNVVVKNDGTWSATFDMSNKPAGLEITAIVFKADEQYVSVEGKTGRVKAAVTFEDQVVENPDPQVKVSSVTLTQGGFVAIHRGSPTGPTIGVSEYLSEGTHQNFEIDIDELPEGEITMIAMVHLDSNGNRTFDFVRSSGVDDSPYVLDDSPVISRATVTVQTPTPTLTNTPSSTTAEKSTPTNIPVSENGTRTSDLPETRTSPMNSESTSTPQEPGGIFDLLPDSVATTYAIFAGVLGTIWLGFWWRRYDKGPRE